MLTRRSWHYLESIAYRGWKLHLFVQACTTLRVREPTQVSVNNECMGKLRGFASNRPFHHNPCLNHSLETNGQLGSTIILGKKIQSVDFLFLTFSVFIVHITEKIHPQPFRLYLRHSFHGSAIPQTQYIYWPIEYNRHR